MAGDHACPICKATFTRPQHVGRHMRSHTGDKPYPCSQCDERFARSDLLSRHVAKAHGPPPDPNAPKPEKNSSRRKKKAEDTWGADHMGVNGGMGSLQGPITVDPSSWSSIHPSLLPPSSSVQAFQLSLQMAAPSAHSQMALQTGPTAYGGVNPGSLTSLALPGSTTNASAQAAFNAIGITGLTDPTLAPSLAPSALQPGTMSLQQPAEGNWYDNPYASYLPSTNGTTASGSLAGASKTSPFNGSATVLDGPSPTDSFAAASSSSGRTLSTSPGSHIPLPFSQHPSAAFFPSYDAASGWQGSMLPDPMANATGVKLKKRACEQCNLSKVKCDFQMPCQKCSARKIPCVYPPPRKPSSKSSRSPSSQQTLSPGPVQANGGGQLQPAAVNASDSVPTGLQEAATALRSASWTHNELAPDSAVPMAATASLSNIQTNPNQNLTQIAKAIAQNAEPGAHPEFAFPGALTMRRTGEATEEDQQSTYSDHGVNAQASGSNPRRTSYANSVVLEQDPNLVANLAMADLNMNDFQNFVQQVANADESLRSLSGDMSTVVPGMLNPQDPAQGNNVRQAWKNFIAQSQPAFNLNPLDGTASQARQPRRPNFLHRGRSNSLPSSSVAPFLQQALDASVRPKPATSLSRDQSQTSNGDSTSLVEEELSEKKGKTPSARPSMATLRPEAKQGTGQTLAPERAPSFMTSFIETPPVDGASSSQQLTKTTSALARPGTKRLASQTLIPENGKRPNGSDAQTTALVTQALGSSSMQQLRRNSIGVSGWAGLSDLPLAEVIASNPMLQGWSSSHNSQTPMRSVSSVQGTTSSGMDTPNYLTTGLTPTLFGPDPFGNYGFDLITPSTSSALRASFLGTGPEGDSAQLVGANR